MVQWYDMGEMSRNQFLRKLPSAICTKSETFEFINEEIVFNLHPSYFVAIVLLPASYKQNFGFKPS